MNLAEIIDVVRSGARSSEDLWLFITGDPESLALETTCELIEDTDNNQELEETIDIDHLGACIAWADRLAGRPDASACADIIRYYIRFDAFPETLGAPDPPPVDETLARLDREFWEFLGEERAGTECRRPNCDRGTVKHSVLCRSHHFESVKNRPCPFAD